MRTAVVFLKEKKNEIVLYAVLVGTFSVVSYLYDIRMDAVEYALLLSVVWLLLSGIWEYLKFAGKHKRLLEAERSLNLNRKELTGADHQTVDVDLLRVSGIWTAGADTLIEEDYQRIIMRLYEAGSEAESAGRIARQEMMDYYGMWVHQIKTPIAAMHVLLQAASESQVEDERTAGEHWKDKEMKLELFKIEQYVEMVLTYLRMEDMSSDMSFEICELDSVIRQAVRKYSQMFILRKIKLDYVPVETKILTDEKWLVFVVEQILSNALKYTHSYSVNERSCSMEDADMNVEQGRISIYMEEYEPAQHGSGVDITESYGAVSRGKKRCLVIEDTGIGICPEDLPRVFEKGFTGYNGRKDKKSTGIGLYLCKAVMDKLRHQIWIESEAGGDCPKTNKLMN
ncbi:MAG: sensor histidine kinase [Dorea sp.]|nr:sensor histidine kinase [Dorea sp.]